MGLKMNIAKTKVMVVDNTAINVNNVLIENVQGYVYLGQHYTASRKRTRTKRCNENHGRLGVIHQTPGYLQNNLAICLKRHVYNSRVLPAMAYGADTWTLTKQAQIKHAAAQTKIERSMLNITCTKIERPTSGSWRGHNS